MLEMANIVRKKKAFESKWKIYQTICKRPQITTYELSKMIGWSSGKIAYYIKKLLKDGLIYNSTEVINGRVHKKYLPKKVGDLINWEEMKHTKKL
ncbi:hypothetical protein ES705_27690 [subsurface metagenome]